MSTNDSNSHYGNTLRRIADGNHHAKAGTGIGPNHLVPVCSITNRSLAATYKQRLIEEKVLVQSRRERLCTRFFVAREDMTNALRIRDELLAEQADSVPREFSRDFDSIFLLAPFAIFVTLIAYVSPRIPSLAWVSSFAWIGVLTTSVTTMIFLERWNRQYRIHFGSQWGIHDLLWATTAVAINVAVWRSVL